MQENNVRQAALPDSDRLSAELASLDKKYHFHPTSSLQQQQQHGPSFIFTEGKGVYLTDVHGDRYMDGLASMWNVNIGHGRAELAEAAREQMAKLAFSSSFLTLSHEPVIRLSAKLAELTPGDLNVSFFTSGGSESNDSVFKIVRHYWKLKGQPDRQKIIARNLAYHGITIGATSATGISQFQRMASAPSDDFLHAAAPYCARCELGMTYPACQLACAGTLRSIIEREQPEKVAAVIVEPIQGAGGVIVPPDGYLQEVRKICDEYGILMIADEVITGFGRTGMMFGVENWDVVPDLMSVAKGITSGYIPLGAVIMSERIRDEMISLSNDTFFHGFTYSGHPTACAVALKNLEIIEREGIVGHVKQMEKVMLDGFRFLEERHPTVSAGRGKGLLGAFELFADRERGTRFDPSVKAASRVVNQCFERKLLVRPITYGGTDIIAMSPPLIMTKNELELMFEIFSDAVGVFEREIGVG
ncbi:aspartate aminotransferase family protein [Brevibacillus sp. B_LB10_24]|uniref:aminotransferase family protein n=1 Tax=Brevibacillus sp. B_LB10_24 TaxID=3380645 RepID=UPI0038BDA388